MKRKIIYAVLMTAVMAFSAGCGSTEDTSKTEDIMTEDSASGTAETENPDAADKETAESENPATEVKDIESMIVEKEDSELNLKEYYYSMEDRTFCDDGEDIFSSLPFESTQPVNYVTKGNVPIYAPNGVRIGYTKEDVDISAIETCGDWCYFYLDRDRRFARISDIAANSITMDERDAVRMAEEAEKQKAATQTQTPAEAVPSGQPVDNTPVEESETPMEEPVSDKYTPEEAVAVYRSIMEAGGITWNPDLKGNWDETIGLYPIEEWNLHMDNYFGGSWGTGWIYLDKGEPERAAQSSLESFAIGNGGGDSWTQYYIEVTGSDKECVYIIMWR